MIDHNQQITVSVFRRECNACDTYELQVKEGANKQVFINIS